MTDLVIGTKQLNGGKCKLPVKAGWWHCCYWLPRMVPGGPGQWLAEGLQRRGCWQARPHPTTDHPAGQGPTQPWLRSQALQPRYMFAQGLLPGEAHEVNL